MTTNDPATAGTSTQLPSWAPRLQAARLVLDQADGEIVVVRMLAGAELPLLRLLPLIRIVEHAQDAETPVDLVLEMVFGQVEGDRREPVQVLLSRSRP